tara:strand:+ start:522 stop:1610 length:1089 start_codon:yes stop_codon:yes gene_type:complete
MKKSIYVHVGPPKTGTSILQSWLSRHIDELNESSNILYPAHGVDENQVSSGHNQLFLDKEQGKKSTFSHSNFQKLLDKFDVASFDTLLLSSEYFFYQIPEFMKYSEKYEIKFIAYVRPEYEFIESIYNQSVKRNRQNMPMAMRNEIRYTYLDSLIEYITTYGNQYFLLRAYGVKNFFEKNIISDFLSIFKLDYLVIENDIIPIINSSYSFDCLEFKRWTNNFLLDGLDNILDKKLQAYTKGNENYTLIPHQTYIDYKAGSKRKITAINDMCPIINYNSLIAYIDKTKRSVYMHQELYDEHLIKVVNFLTEEDFKFTKKLFLLISSQDNLTEKDKHKLSIFKKELSHAQNRNPFRSFLSKLLR